MQGTFDLNAASPQQQFKGHYHPQRTSIVKRILDPLISILPGTRGKKQKEGIIAPRSPASYSPAASPAPGGSWSFGDAPSPGSPAPGGGATWAMGAGGMQARRPISLANPPPKRAGTDDYSGPGKSWSADDLQANALGGGVDALGVRPNSRIGRRSPLASSDPLED